MKKQTKQKSIGKQVPQVISIVHDRDTFGQVEIDPNDLVKQAAYQKYLKQKKNQAFGFNSQLSVQNIQKSEMGPNYSQIGKQQQMQRKSPNLAFTQIQSPLPREPLQKSPREEIKQYQRQLLGLIAEEMSKMKKEMKAEINQIAQENATLKEKMQRLQRDFYQLKKSTDYESQTNQKKLLPNPEQNSNVQVNQVHQATERINKSKSLFNLLYMNPKNVKKQSPARIHAQLGTVQKENMGDSHVSLVEDSDEQVGEERSEDRDRSINQISETVYTNFIPNEKKFEEYADGFMSDECDEKRSYTPQPRQVKMNYQKIGRIPTNQAFQDRHESIALNKSTLSAIPAKSDCMSEIGENLIQYISKSRKNTFSKAKFDPLREKSHTVDNRSANNSKIDKLETKSFQDLMEQKGSKCKCNRDAKTKCGTYCKRLGPTTQRRIVTNLLQQEQKKQTAQREWQPKRYLINQRWWSQWCDFVNFDQKQVALDNSYDINLLPKPNNNVDLTYIDLSDDSNEISQLYEKPGRIINSKLIAQEVKRGDRMRLRENLIEHFDFEALHPSVWKHLYSWYSADVQVVRSLKKDALNRHVMILDLYPETDQLSRYAYQSGCQNLLSDEEGDNKTKKNLRENMARSITPQY